MNAESDVRQRVDQWLARTLGPPDARASVTFLGTEPIEVLRWITVPGDDDSDEGGHSGAGGEAAAGAGGSTAPLVRYGTLGMSAAPMTDPTAAVADPDRGPRAELLLTLRAGRADTDGALRPLAVLAASPQVEGLVVAPGVSLDVGEPLWPGAPFTSALVDDPGVVPQLELPAPHDPVRFLPLLPMTPHEAAWKRARGADALRERWAAHTTDLLDPRRSSVPLTG